MNLGRRMVHQPYHGSFEIIHDPNHQVHHNPRVPDHVLLVIDFTSRKASQSNYYIITTGKLNADWSNKQYLQHNKSCNKAQYDIPVKNSIEKNGWALNWPLTQSNDQINNADLRKILI